MNIKYNFCGHNTIKLKNQIGGEKIMTNSDTIRLLNECDAGIKMAVSSIDEVLPSVRNEKLKHRLTVCKNEHEKLGNEAQAILSHCGDDGKEPNPIAKSMSWVKTNMKLSMDPNDKTVADIVFDGCNMGVKSLNRYLNEYNSAEEQAKNITGKLIRSEEQLSTDLRKFL